MHYDGKSWTPTGPKITTYFVAGRLWGRGSRLWLLMPEVSPNPAQILAYDGKIWSQTSGVLASDQLQAIWCHSSTFAVATGYAAAWRWDGTNWTKDVMPGKYNYLHAVWGSGPNDVYAGSQRGIMAHWNGKVWDQIPTGWEFGIKDIHSLNAKNIWAGGVGGLMRRK